MPQLRARMSRTLSDPLAAYPALRDFAVFAGDGHFHAAAVHDPRDPDGTKYATGHLYMLDLRSHAAHHLDVGDQKARKKEHDMRTLKRQTPAALRCGTPTGRKVILVWDRAAIDFHQWRLWKENSGIYFISRPKENMNLAKQGDWKYDPADPVNTGILADEMKAGRIISPLREALQRYTQRSVKFIRWLRSFLFGEASWDRMLAALRKIYQTS